jgi:hypothetical protein
MMLPYARNKTTLYGAMNFSWPISQNKYPSKIAIVTSNAFPIIVPPPFRVPAFGVIPQS